MKAGERERDRQRHRGEGGRGKNIRLFEGMFCIYNAPKYTIPLHNQHNKGNFIFIGRTVITCRIAVATLRVFSPSSAISLAAPLLIISFSACPAAANTED